MDEDTAIEVIGKLKYRSNDPPSIAQVHQCMNEVLKKRRRGTPSSSSSSPRSRQNSWSLISASMPGSTAMEMRRERRHGSGLSLGGRDAHRRREAVPAEQGRNS